MYKIFAAALFGLTLTAPVAKAQTPNDFKQVDQITFGDTYHAIYTKGRHAETIPLYSLPVYLGSFNCKIDGRDATMKWAMPTRVTKLCSQSQPNVCKFEHVTSPAVGYFTEVSRKGPTVNLTLLYGAGGALNMRHPDGNTWELSATKWSVLKNASSDTTNVVSHFNGFTMWQGKKYPLTCTRRY